MRQLLGRKAGKRVKTAVPCVIEDAAADWLVRKHSGLTADEQNGLALWLAEEPRHQAVFTRLERAWEQLNRPRQEGAADLALVELTRRRHRRFRRKVTAVSATLAVAAVLAFALFPSPAPAPVTAATLTAVVHPDARRLPDGSVVELNAGAQFAYNFTGTERDVSLTKGEALFSVAHDKVHPFIVAAGGIKVRAVGTAFNVRLRSDAVDILVTEGRVKVDVPGSDEPIYVAAGERTTVAMENGSMEDGSGPMEVNHASADEVRQELAWHSQRIEFTHAPLSEVVEIFNRENALKIRIGDGSIRDLQITGIYWADDPEGFLRLLKSGLDLRTERMESQVVLRAP